jgi:hypothetical protein
MEQPNLLSCESLFLFLEEVSMRFPLFLPSISEEWDLPLFIENWKISKIMPMFMYRLLEHLCSCAVYNYRHKVKRVINRDNSNFTVCPRIYFNVILHSSPSSTIASFQAVSTPDFCMNFRSSAIAFHSDLDTTTLIQPDKLNYEILNM